MTVALLNAQREHRVPVRRLGVLARRAIRRLRVRTPGTLAIAFVPPARMRRLHGRFLRDASMTDVLTFRYPGEPACLPRRLPALRAAQQAGARRRQVVGEVVIAPAAARAYARRHRLSYEAELSRYVIHGLLHWKGHRDSTISERRKMRMLEDRLLTQCGMRNSECGMLRKTTPHSALRTPHGR